MFTLSCVSPPKYAAGRSRLRACGRLSHIGAHLPADFPERPRNPSTLRRGTHKKSSGSRGCMRCTQGHREGKIVAGGIHDQRGPRPRVGARVPARYALPAAILDFNAVDLDVGLPHLDMKDAVVPIVATPYNGVARAVVPDGTRGTDDVALLLLTLIVPGVI